MPVVDNSKVQEFALPGLLHRTVGGKDGGVKSMEVWQQTIAPGAATPVHRHACEEVIVILSGSGTLMIDGETTAFGPNSTLILPHDVVHQIVNTSAEEMHLIATLSMSPVRVRTGDGTPMPLPWDAR
jgi:mannose-6-phosphate isomerase-like protein (cupin superfamily)